MIKKGNTDIGAVYLGSTAISAIYKGATEIWSAGISYLGKFFTRSTAGGTSIGSGTAKIKSLRGNSTVQSGRLLDFVSTPNTLFNQLAKIINSTNWGLLAATGTIDDVNHSITFTPTSGFLGVTNKDNINIVQSHKYYFTAKVLCSESGSYLLNRLAGLVNSLGAFTANTLRTVKEIWTATSTSSSKLIIGDTRSSGWTATTMKNIMLVDLTAIFGAGNEPSSVAEFEQWMRMYGMNPDDFQEYNTGGTLNGSRIESRNSNDVVIGSVKLPTPSTGNLILRSAGNVYDEVIGTKVIRRVGAVDLGSLNYVKGNRNNDNTAFIFFTADDIQGIKPNTSNILCKLQRIINFDSWEELPKDNYLYSGGYLVIAGDYSTAAAFKAAMSGVYANYELATPTEETIPAWSNTYQAENGGTETLLPANTSEPYTSEVWVDILYKR